MPRKKIVKSRKIVESHDDAVLCVAWFMEYLFENIENYLYAFPRREMQILNYRVWGAKKWEVKFRKEHSISDSQAEYMDLQAVVGEKLAMEDENIPIGGELQRLKHRWLCLLWRKPSLKLSRRENLV